MIKGVKNVLQNFMQVISRRMMLYSCAKQLRLIKSRHYLRINNIIYTTQILYNNMEQKKL